MNQRLLQDCLEELSNGGFPLTGGGENAILGGMKANDKRTLAETIADEMRAEDGELLMEMANQWQEDTLLPMIIWIDEGKTYKLGGHGKRVKFQLDTSDSINPGLWGSMDLGGKLHLTQKARQALRLSQRDLNQLRNFVRNNRLALEELADTRIRMRDIHDDIIKGGDPAPPEQIQALNDKVAALVAARSQKNQSAPTVATRAPKRRKR